ncbi:hypothetical protein GCM10025768_14570 [Microbacterium pseudoresistens]|uniref:Uncharacterized protein n=1 Tax=Microbacterium pseudoresistens TaxID=640634 RepID=A0A7Y9ESL9_9MICO|nr:hypothetical protein [Microbacterium pseudoresistens]NYD53189.1 hypothetical protein [Microbacterium pseudoresistens]
MTAPEGSGTDAHDAFDPARALALAADQQRDVAARTGGFVPLVLVAWGLAWLLGFAALWLVEGLAPAFALPMAVAAPVLVVLFVAAGILSTTLATRAGRGVRGGKEAAFAGIVYGQGWWIGTIAVYVLGLGLVHNGMDPDLLTIFFPSAFVFFAGIMYLMAGALWHALPMLWLGVWAIVVGCAAPFAGAPAHFLVYALAGGGGFLLAGGVSAWWIARTRRRFRATTGAGERSVP